MNDNHFISAIEATLPWGFHDAHLEGLDLDYPHAVLVLRMRVPISKPQDLDRRCTLRIRGLAFCAIDPPALGEFELTPGDGLWIGSGEGAAGDAHARLPAIPEGCFLHWFYVHSWNSFIHVCGRSAELTWTEDAPVPARGSSRARFPGDEV